MSQLHSIEVRTLDDRASDSGLIATYAATTKRIAERRSRESELDLYRGSRRENYLPIGENNSHAHSVAPVTGTVTVS
jgi:hypothetical protein